MVSTGPRAGAGKGSRLELRRCAWASVQLCGVRGNRNLPRQKERCSACVDILASLFMQWSTSAGFDKIKVESVPVVVSSTSELHFSSTAGMVVGLGAGCTQVGTWLVLGNSSTRLSGRSSSLYVHANWDRITLSLAWNKTEKKTLIKLIWYG